MEPNSLMTFMLVLADMHWGLWYKGLLLEKPRLGFLRLQLGEAGGILVGFPAAKKAVATLSQ